MRKIGKDAMFVNQAEGALILGALIDWKTRLYPHKERDDARLQTAVDALGAALLEVVESKYEPETRRYAVRLDVTNCRTSFVDAESAEDAKRRALDAAKTLEPDAKRIDAVSAEESECVRGDGR